MVVNPLDLTGSVAIVTGAGRGIGLEIARTLAQNGADIVIAEMITENGQEAEKEIKALGGKALFVQTDVRSPESVNAMTQAAVDAFGKIDILVNNAGIARNSPAEDTPDDEWNNVIDVNVNGVFWCCRAVGRQMLAQGSGAIVNIASMSGIIVNKPQPQAAYNVSKAAVIMLTKSLAAEWAQRGVRVNAVSPGYIGTDMTQQGLSNPEWREMWHEMTPMHIIGEPVDIANAVLFLASPAAKFATGSNLVVDGGYTAW